MSRRFGPGRLRRQLAELLAKRLHADGHKVAFNPEKLWPAQGYWRTSFGADVYRWEGQFEIWRHDKWETVSIGSWSTMTDCSRGFDYDWDGYFAIEVYAKADRTHPALVRARAAGARI